MMVPVLSFSRTSCNRVHLKVMLPPFGDVTLCNTPGYNGFLYPPLRLEFQGSAVLLSETCLGSTFPEALAPVPGFVALIKVSHVSSPCVWPYAWEWVLPEDYGRYLMGLTAWLPPYCFLPARRRAICLSNFRLRRKIFCASNFSLRFIW